MDNGVDKSHILYVIFEDLEYSFIADEMGLHNYIKPKILYD